jgi:WD40 repeat protein
MTEAASVRLPDRVQLACALILHFSAAALGQQPAGENQAQPAAAAPPQLRLETGGPITFVSSLAFSPTSDTLLVGGADKRVDMWRLFAEADEWQRDAAGTFRIPIGPGNWGEVNALAVSHDGQQLAIGGRMPQRRLADWRRPGWVVPTVGLEDESQDRGTIYLFDVRTREVRPLRGHRGAVLSLVYVAPARGQPRCLVSAAAERDDNNTNQWNLVVRLWNTDELAQGNAYLSGAKAAPCPAKPTIRPAIAAWRFGAQPRQIGVAFANDSGRPDKTGELCLANMENQRRDPPITDGFNNRTVAYVPGTEQLVTGSFNELKLWNVRGWPAQQPVSRKLPLATPSGSFKGLAPVAMSVVPDGNGALKRLALVLRYVFQDGKKMLEDDRLQLVDLTTLQKVGQASSLWRQGKTPTLAVSRDGRRLAVTGSQTHEVRLYATSELGRQQVQPRQVLRGEGERFVEAAFVKSAERLGLLLIRSSQSKPPGRLPRQPQAGDLVLDADRGELTTELDGWQTLVPDASWSAESEVKTEQGKQWLYLRARHAGFQGTPIRLPWGEAYGLSDCAVLPPGGDRPPLLAVATHFLGQPSLYLYDAQRGQCFRRFDGHVERLRSLAFHPDGTMLVSTADDQTVCVWSLVDWRECLGRRGSLTGVGVERRNSRLRVAANPDGEPIAGGQLQPGDLIEAMLEDDGQRDRVVRPYDLYSNVLRRKPGESVSLFVSRGGGAVRPMSVQVGQAIDQRLPLCSLFCTRKAQRNDNRADQVDWLAWSPSGAYDASGPDIEERIGWHFNTGQPEAPVRYALAAEYARLRRGGLLDELLHHPEKAPTPPQDPPPELSLWIDPHDQDADLPVAVVKGGPVRVDNCDLSLRASIDGLHSRLIRSVGWRAAKGELQPMTALDSIGRDFAADLSTQNWRRGERLLECVVATNDVRHPTLRQEIRLTFAPPPRPTITVIQPAKPTFTSTEKRLPVQAEITTARNPPLPIKVVLEHFAMGQVQHRKQWSDLTTIAETLELQPGENRIRLTAVASDASPDEEDQENKVVVLKVYYQPTNPRLNLEVVSDGGEKRVLADVPAKDENWLVEGDEVTIQGTIAADDKLDAAGWRWSDETDWHLFDRFDRGKREVNVQEKISLLPGRHRLECRAQTAGQPASVGEGAVAIEWQPPLPQLGPVRLSPPRITEGIDPPEVELSGEWQLDPRLQPFEIKLELLRDDAPLKVPVEVDQVRRAFHVRAPASFTAANRFQFRVANKWRWQKLEAPQVDVRRPPRIIKVHAPPESPVAHVDLTFFVESPTGLDLREVRVNDVTLPPESKQPERRGSEMTIWRVDAKNIPLNQGRNQLTLTARNDHDWTVKPAIAEVVVPEPPPPLAEIAIESPTQDEPFAVPYCDVFFNVSSTTRLSQVELLRNGQVVAKLDVGKQQATKAHGFTLRETVRVALPDVGRHVISVAATNDGGLEHPERTVSYLPPPVVVEVEQINTLGPEAIVFRAEMGEEGYRFPELPTGTVRLSGTVSWQADDRPAPSVEVSVNGYRQLNVVPEEPDKPDAPRTRRWQARLCLNRKVNRVEIEIPGSARDAGARLSFPLGCLAPLNRQRLHLLVIGIGNLDREKLQKDALDAVQATDLEAVPNTDKKRFKTPAFDGLLFQRVVPEIDPPVLKQNVRGLLTRIEETQNHEPGSDLFMLYYRGAEAVDENGRFRLWTSLAANRPDASISDQELERLFERRVGAHLCLLDVQRQTGNSGPRAVLRARSDDRIHPHTGVLRSAWLRAGDRPSDAWLVIWFRQAMAKKAETLADIRSEIDKVYRDCQARYPEGLQWEPDIPAALNDLVLGAP